MSPDPTETQASETLLQNAYSAVVAPLLYFLVTLAAAVFLWGLIEFIAGAGNEEKRRQGQKHMLWGVIGIFVMLSVFGIVSIIANTLGVNVPIKLN